MNRVLLADDGHRRSMRHPTLRTTDSPPAPNAWSVGTPAATGPKPLRLPRRQADLQVVPGRGKGLLRSRDASGIPVAGSTHTCP